jgi:hypothetical protein
MAVAAYAPFLVLFPPLWLSVLPATGLLVGGHLLMLVATAAAMVRRDQHARSQRPGPLHSKVTKDETMHQHVRALLVR